MSVFLSSGQESLFFYVIMTVLKFVFSGLIGFIIDHVQYTFNLLFGSQLLILFSYCFYIVFIVKMVTDQILFDYLYFANGFLIVGEQLGSIIILTLISKHFESQEVPYQIGTFQKYSFLGTLFSYLIVFIILILYFVQNLAITKFIQKYEYNIIILSIIPLIILLTETIFLYYSFPQFKNEAEELMPEIKTIPVQQKGNLLQALKNIFKTDSAWVALSAGIIMGIIKIWLGFQQNQLFKDSNDYILIYLIIYAFLPTLISFCMISRIVKNYENEQIPLQALIDKSIESFVYFILSILIVTSVQQKIDLGQKILLYIVFGIFQILQQYYLTVISISGVSMIGIHKENYKNQGLTFGLLSMIENGFAVWVVLAMAYGDHKEAIVYGFAFGYTLISIISSKMLQFDKQVNKTHNKVRIMEEDIRNGQLIDK
ncbi:unnamed protein product [Paramecium sonneborni]|uniref:Uncharacterized protein n=1 Tax=Paramecium sonneborni TaxID=65129 RepID=A0A8S1N5I5_9CILI|nr:unnamed protein product [Paramecium sonneborni]